MHRAVHHAGIDHATVPTARGQDAITGARRARAFLPGIEVDIIQHTVIDKWYPRIGSKRRGKATVMAVTVGPFGVPRTRFVGVQPVF